MKSLRPSCLALFLCALFFSMMARGQFSQREANVVHSVTGQFIVTGSAQFSLFAHSPEAATNADLVRLEPALLAITAERINYLLRHKLEIEPGAPWRGKIFLVLHPAISLDEEVAIISLPADGNWNYRVELPDVMTQTRFLRAMTSVLLLEFAGRTAKPGGHSAEIPAWLADGLSQQLLSEATSQIIFSSPNKVVNGLAQNRTVTTERGLDPLAGARTVLRDQPALNFEELSWPTDTQLDGDDGGAYRASAQLFVAGLLALKNGPAHLREMVSLLPAYYNWQTAFQTVFHPFFPRPLDVEKWWSLQVVGFATRDRSQMWTPAVSREKLNELLAVPVNVRASSNALPTFAEVSLQTVIRSFEKPRQTEIMRTKWRDLQVAQLRMSGPLAVLTDGYRRALAGYLGERTGTALVTTFRYGRQSPLAPPKVSAEETVRQLDILDARRRAVEISVKPDVLQLR